MSVHMDSNADVSAFLRSRKFGSAQEGANMLRAGTEIADQGVELVNAAADLCPEVEIAFGSIWINLIRIHTAVRSDIQRQRESEAEELCRAEGYSE